MRRRNFLAAAGALGASARGQSTREVIRLATPFPGVWQATLGTPERITPVARRSYPPAADSFAALPEIAEIPVEVRGQRTSRGFLLRLPLQPGELVYGLGLQLKSFIQRGLKKTLRVNSDPVADTGDSHAPVPFYVSTAGYGVLVDTARYATFWCGNKKRRPRKGASGEPPAAAEAPPGVDKLPPAYGRFRFGEASEVLIEIPGAQGADVYIFGGPTMLQAVQRYNLFSGGGALPPRWGLGFWYRCHGQFDQNQVLAAATDLRQSRIPCEVLGLEPGWQSHAYSCSFAWSEKFPEPAAMLRALADQGFRVNLWEHAFTHPTSPIYEPLLPYSGDYEVWDGLVPDFLTPAAGKIFAAFHEKEHVSIGVSGYKLDECDNSDFTRNWSFPEISRFPSGADGEQMHCLFGRKYQDAIQSIFIHRKEPTYGLARSAHALAAPYPYVLYSDLYDHRDFIRGLVNCGFSGLLWCPEVRDAQNAEDLIRRLQTVIFSPLAMVNAWYIKDPPWKQYGAAVEDQCRAIIELRAKLLPNLEAAFDLYAREGVPPFRALVLDYPGDPATWTVDNQYMMGADLMVAPVVHGERERDVYLPEGEWTDFFTGEKLAGRRSVKYPVPLNRFPVFRKATAT